MPTTSQLSLVHRYLGKAAANKAVNLGDGELLQRFVAQSDAGAFEAILARHGPMVFNVCRRILHHSQAAEDAFQATFLVLVRKAPSIRCRGSLSSWLYGVACRTAARAKVDAAKRQAREKVVPSRQEPDPALEITVRE